MEKDVKYASVHVQQRFVDMKPPIMPSPRPAAEGDEVSPWDHLYRKLRGLEKRLEEVWREIARAQLKRDVEGALKALGELGSLHGQLCCARLEEFQMTGSVWRGN